jgi:hypothetical protein
VRRAEDRAGKSAIGLGMDLSQIARPVVMSVSSEVTGLVSAIIDVRETLGLCHYLRVLQGSNLWIMTRKESWLWAQVMLCL